MRPHQRTVDSLTSRFAARAGQCPDRVAVEVLTEDGREVAASLTYGELEQRANALCALLVRRGVRPGDRVVALLPRSLELCVSLVAVAQAGAVYVPVDPLARPDVRAYALEDSGARVALVGEHVDWPDRPTWIECITVGPGFGAGGDAGSAQIEPRSGRTACLLYPALSLAGPGPARLSERVILRGASADASVGGCRYLHVASPATDTSVFELWEGLLGGMTAVVWPAGPGAPIAVAASSEPGRLTAGLVVAADGDDADLAASSEPAATCGVVRLLNPMPSGLGRLVTMTLSTHLEDGASRAAGDRQASADRHRQLEQELMDLAERVMEDSLPSRDPSTPLLELGFDSLLLAHASMVLSEEYGVELTLRQLLEQTPTVERLAAHLLAVGAVRVGDEAGVLALPTVAPSRWVVPKAVAKHESRLLEQLAELMASARRGQASTAAGRAVDGASGVHAMLHRRAGEAVQALARLGRAPAVGTRHRDRPPEPGARLGRDPLGNPGWFIPDPERPGKYRQIVEGR